MENKAKELYKSLFKKYLNIFIYEKAKKIPENCMFNLRHPLDVNQYNADGSPNVAYNRLDCVKVACDGINANDSENLAIIINGDKFSVPKRYFFDTSYDQQSGILHTTARVARDYNLPYFVDTTGLCKLTLEREGIEQEIKLCDTCDDAKNCPAFLTKYSKASVESAFWTYALENHKDLMVIKCLIGSTEKPSFWQRILIGLKF